MKRKLHDKNELNTFVLTGSEIEGFGTVDGMKSLTLFVLFIRLFIWLVFFVYRHGSYPSKFRWNINHDTALGALFHYEWRTTNKWKSWFLIRDRLTRSSQSAFRKTVRLLSADAPHKKPKNNIKFFDTWVSKNSVLSVIPRRLIKALNMKNNLRDTWNMKYLSTPSHMK